MNTIDFRHTAISKILSIGALCLFLFNQVAFAYPDMLAVRAGDVEVWQEMRAEMDRLHKDQQEHERRDALLAEIYENAQEEIARGQNPTMVKAVEEEFPDLVGEVIRWFVHNVYDGQPGHAVELLLAKHLEDLLSVRPKVDGDIIVSGINLIYDERFTVPHAGRAINIPMYGIPKAMQREHIIRVLVHELVAGTVFAQDPTKVHNIANEVADEVVNAMVHKDRNYDKLKATLVTVRGRDDIVNIDGLVRAIEEEDTPVISQLASWDWDIDEAKQKTLVGRQLIAYRDLADESEQLTRQAVLEKARRILPHQRIPSYQELIALLKRRFLHRQLGPNSSPAEVLNALRHLLQPLQQHYGLVPRGQDDTSLVRLVDTPPQQLDGPVARREGDAQEPPLVELVDTPTPVISLGETPEAYGGSFRVQWEESDFYVLPDSTIVRGSIELGEDVFEEGRPRPTRLQEMILIHPEVIAWLERQIAARALEIQNKWNSRDFGAFPQTVFSEAGGTHGQIARLRNYFNDPEQTLSFRQLSGLLSWFEKVLQEEYALANYIRQSYDSSEIENQPLYPYLICRAALLVWISGEGPLSNVRPLFWSRMWQEGVSGLFRLIDEHYPEPPTTRLQSIVNREDSPYQRIVRALDEIRTGRRTKVEVRDVIATEINNLDGELQQAFGYLPGQFVEMRLAAETNFAEWAGEIGPSDATPGSPAIYAYLTDEGLTISQLIEKLPKGQKRAQATLKRDLRILVQAGVAERQIGERGVEFKRAENILAYRTGLIEKYLKYLFAKIRGNVIAYTRGEGRKKLIAALRANFVQAEASAPRTKSFDIPNPEGKKVACLVNLPDETRFTGKRPVVFLFHGLSGFKTEPQLQAFADRFVKEGYIVVRPDFRNNKMEGKPNESDGALTDFSLEDELDDATTVIRWLQNEMGDRIDFSNTIVGGHSYGGFIARQIAAMACAKLDPTFRTLGIQGIIDMSGIISPRGSLMKVLERQKAQEKITDEQGAYEQWKRTNSFGPFGDQRFYIEGWEDRAAVDDLNRIPGEIPYIYIIGTQDDGIKCTAIPEAAKADEFMSQVGKRRLGAVLQNYEMDHKYPVELLPQIVGDVYARLSHYNQDAQTAVDVVRQLPQGAHYTVIANTNTAEEVQTKAFEQLAAVIQEANKKDITIEVIREAKGKDAPAYTFQCYKQKDGVLIGETAINVYADSTSLDRTNAILNLGLAASAIPSNLQRRDQYDEALIERVNKAYKALDLVESELIKPTATAKQINKILHDQENPITIVLPPVEMPEELNKKRQLELQADALRAKFA